MESTEYSFAMLKPGVLQRRLVGEVVGRIERKGLRIVALRMLKLTRELCERHYEEHRGKYFFEPLVEYMSSGPVVAFVVAGKAAVRTLRELAGPTTSEDAPGGTIRGDLAATTRKNIIHASDSAAGAAREISLFFGADAIIDWEDPNEHWLI